ncbi:MAG: TonB-dependent receptor [uncultured Sphingomonadaceae bacterium]|uniref:TonB-dependent receptor n=1 Tax=uncultured Sphingomonadaceae bacterium TaxID=169976 RepID=A0A6J4U3B6_9SPHN|nr:MAG: TonB-dependent receptor [uncultured Sphingomonadaceae bacterium]
MKFDLRQRLLASTLIGAAFIATPAWAQQDDQADQENAISATADPTSADTELASDDGEIVVTGSRIQRRDLVSTSPLAVVNDEEFKLSGAVNAEQVINTLPQVIPGSTGADNNPGGGVATLDLRGLGTNRNLVLVNGRRYIFFDTSQVVDINTIPSFLIDSVDVVTGGASAVYGSDALAGVVNFRLRDDIQGVEVGGGVNLTERGDGRRYNAFVALGTRFADDRGHIVAFGEYFNRQAVFQGDRGFSAFAQNDNATGTGFVPGGSSTTPEGRLIFQGTGAPAGNVFGGGGAFFATPGTARRRVGTDVFNYAPDNFLQVPQERYLLGAYGEFEVSNAVTIFGETTFVNNRVANELAATPVTGTFRVNVAQQQQFLDAATFGQLQAIDTAQGAANDPGFVNLFVQRRVEETGPRNTLDERNAFRILAGVKGPVFGEFNYEAYYSYARTRNANVQSGNVSRRSFQAGLDGTGTPINIFGAGTLTPAQVASFSILAQNNDISTLEVASGSINGRLGNLGLGGGDIGLAIGAEYRRVASQFIPDTALQSGDVIGFNAGQATEGSYNVKEIFGELAIPIIADRPFFHRLELNGAARYSDYSLDAVGGVFTYSGGVTFAPVRDVTFRGQYQKAIRAPNVAELFGGAQLGFPAATDPCALASAATNATVRNLCIATGVPATSVGSPDLQLNDQIEGTFGGNPNLQEERGETYTVGVVLRPSFIPRLTITLDGYDIEIKGAIDSLGGGVNNILNICYNVVQDINSEFCQAVNRDPQGIISGDQFSIAAVNANSGVLKTRGVDLQVDYSVPLGFALLGSGGSKLNIFFLGTYLDKFDSTPVAVLPDEVDRLAGRFGILASDEPLPKYKWTSRLSLIDGPLTTSVRWRHIGSTRDDDDATTFTVERLRAYNLVDLAFSIDATDAVSFAFGVNNLLDKKPQIIGSNQAAANTYPNTFDVLGRDYFVSANLRF